MTPRRRLLTSLASHTSNLGKATVAPLLPPYSHQSATVPSLRPPYSHPIQAYPEGTSRVDRLKPRQRYSLVPNGGARTVDDSEDLSRAWQSWAVDKLSTDEGRREILTSWERILNELQQGRQAPRQIPQIASHALASHLASPTTLKAIKDIGVLVVRDVVPDAEAIAWARDVLEASVDRSSPVYWHRSLLEARSHPSLIATNDRLLSALKNEEVECFIRSEGVQEGIAGSVRTSSVNQNTWQGVEEISAHLCLTPLFSSPSHIYTTIHPSIHSAAYSTLRPLLRPISSRISFYQSQTAEYLRPSNWTLVDSLPSNASASALGDDLPHLDDGFVPLPILNPGDIMYRNSTSPIRTSISTAPTNEVESQLFLPVNPIARSISSMKLVAAQKEAFEQGVPPPSARFLGETISLEEKGSREMIGSHGGRRAMGYSS